MKFTLEATFGRMKSARFALLWCTACAPASSYALATAIVRSRVPAAAPEAAIKVQLDIFSGRPNPEWALTGGEARNLAERLAALPPAAPRELSANLGYRGFLVTIRPPTGEVSARIQDGIAEITSGGRTTYHEDRDRKLESWLILTCKAAVPTDLQLTHPAPC